MESISNVQKKRRRGGPRLRWVWLALGAAALALILGLNSQMNRPKIVTPQIADTEQDEPLTSHAMDEVERITVRLRSGEQWTVRCAADGTLWTEGDDSFQVNPKIAESMLDAAAVVIYYKVLSEDPAEYGERLADFGLTEPRAVVEIGYRDGSSITLRTGDKSSGIDDPFYYMMVDGDLRLYALDTETRDQLVMEKALLREVTQPTIHKARIDRVSIALPEGEYAWQLRGGITDGDAADRWFLTSPVTYPADGEAIDRMRTNLENIRLGAWVASASRDNLTAYGFDAPRMVLTIHMAAGALGTVSELGTYDVVDWPESMVTITVGAAQSDMVDYVRVEDSIYLTSHFLLDVFMSVNPADTLTRYPVLTSLSNLSRLVIETSAGTSVYEVTRTEQVAANNDLVYDEEGHIVCDVTVTKNGQEIGWGAFEAAYNDLLMVTVSGSLPKGWVQTEAPHTKYTFETVTGVTHTIELARFDAMHDAVIVDGCAMFYLINGGLHFALENE